MLVGARVIPENSDSSVDYARTWSQHKLESKAVD
jgi:hypothetical protein